MVVYDGCEHNLRDGTPLRVVAGSRVFAGKGMVRAYLVTQWAVGMVDIELTRDGVSDTLGATGGIRLVARVIGGIPMWVFVGDDDEWPCLIGDGVTGGGVIVCGMDRGDRGIRDLTSMEIGCVTSALAWVEADVGRGKEGWFALLASVGDEGVAGMIARPLMEVVDDA